MMLSFQIAIPAEDALMLLFMLHHATYLDIRSGSSSRLEEQAAPTINKQNIDDGCVNDTCN